jgi:hypothetical protein
MSNKQISKAATILIKARDFLSDINNWCPEGHGENGYHQDAMTKREQFCVLRALSEIFSKSEPFDAPWVVHQEYEDLRKYVHALVTHTAYNHFKRGDGSGASIIDVNGMGHEAVLKLFDHAISEEVHTYVL